MASYLNDLSKEEWPQARIHIWRRCFCERRAWEWVSPRYQSLDWLLNQTKTRCRRGVMSGEETGIGLGGIHHFMALSTAVESGPLKVRHKVDSVHLRFTQQPRGC